MASLERFPAAVRRSHLAVAVTLALTTTFTARPSAAQDGSYGRFDSDLSLTGELGVVAGTRGGAFAARLGASYLTMAGVYAQFEERPSAERAESAHRFSAGLELRPLFLARFVNDLERGPARLDLWLDSFGVGLGAYSRWGGALDCVDPCYDHGLEFAGRMALPMLPSATGPFVGVRVGARVPLDGPQLATAAPTEVFGMLSLGYEHVLGAGLLRRVE